MKPEEKISNAIVRLIAHNPFFGVLLSSLDKIEDDTIYCSGVPTIATDGFRIFYHPQFVSLLSEQETEAVLVHEIFHGIFRHCDFSRIAQRNIELWNVCCDYAVNVEIDLMEYKLPKGALIDYQFKDMLPEEIYERLQKNYIDIPIRKFDIHLPLSAKDKEILLERILSASLIAKDSIGDLSLGVRRAIGKLKEPKVSWQRIFHHIIGQTLAGVDFTYNPPDKRVLPYEIYLPSLHSYGFSNLVIAVDTSGSISKDQLTQFASEIKNISYLVQEAFIITCDAKIQETVEIQQCESFFNKIDFKGSGGTDFRPIFEFIEKKRLYPDLLIFLTDGEARYPQKNHYRYPVLWVLTKEHKVPWGYTLVIPKQ